MCTWFACWSVHALLWASAARKLLTPAPAAEPATAAPALVCLTLVLLLGALGLRAILLRGVEDTQTRARLLAGAWLLNVMSGCTALWATATGHLLAGVALLALATCALAAMPPKILGFRETA